MKGWLECNDLATELAVELKTMSELDELGRVARLREDAHQLYLALLEYEMLCKVRAR